MRHTVPEVAIRNLKSEFCNRIIPISAFRIPNSNFCSPPGKLCHPWEIIAPEFRLESNSGYGKTWHRRDNS
ncbi:hypothetical protein D1BOALGB6SA_4481 [Olavius sp. associated proteobacterium Delta 1]|nr:hypothetical protein D1BOALGB6SA_4481 [Olavius sp. associated proteobacterium Delta 1]